jgi:16S rRNA (guanine527-N7)-methyltransferase
MDIKNNCGKAVEDKKYSTIKENNFRKDILVGSLAMGINLTAENIDDLIVYLKTIQEYQRKINITSTRDSYEIIYKHFLDSFSCVQLVNRERKNFPKKQKIIDVGSGAGLPGIPIKILLSETKMTLLEARKNKKEFLDIAVSRLGLKNTFVLQNRAENLGKTKEHREKYHIVLSRAVASLGILAEYCLPLCKIGGIVIAFKGSSYWEEVNMNQKVVEKLGGSLESINLIKNFNSVHVRSILVIRKIELTPENFPRRNGIPQKRPLCF